MRSCRGGPLQGHHPAWASHSRLALLLLALFFTFARHAAAAASYSLASLAPSAAPSTPLSILHATSRAAGVLGLTSSPTTATWTPQPGLLLFKDTDVSYTTGDMTTTGKFRTYYYSIASLTTGGRTFLLQPANDSSLCLTFQVTNTTLDPAAVAGLPLQLLACKFDSSGRPSLKSQLFKLIRSCSRSSAQAPSYILQQWTAGESASTTTSPLVAVCSPLPSRLCLQWSPDSGQAVQQPCTFDTTQQWQLPAAPGSSSPSPTQDLCPAAPEALFNVSSPTALVTTLATVLGCPAATLQLLAKAASNSSLSLLAPCFSLNMYEVMLYDGQFTLLMFFRGRRDPFQAATQSITSMVASMSSVWGASGVWPSGRQLQAWVRALDVNLLQSSTLLQTPPLLSAPSSAAYSLPWSLLASTDHLSIICPASPLFPKSSTLYNATVLPSSTLDPSLLSVFRAGLRNLTLQGCGITGPLPPAWPSAGPLTPGTYVNLYPTYLDLSFNALTGNLPPAYLDWSSCYIARLNLGYNRLNVDLNSSALDSACTNQGGRSVCDFLVSVGRSTAAFTRHALYTTGPTNASALSSCGLLTQGMGYAGVSWERRAPSRVFVYNWQWASPSQDCVDLEGCDPGVNSYDVKGVAVSPVLLSLILDGNVVSVEAGHTLMDKYAAAPWFAMATCDKKTMFGDRIHNSCDNFSPHPVLEAVWLVILVAACICFVVGLLMRRRALRNMQANNSKDEAAADLGPADEGRELQPQILVIRDEAVNAHSISPSQSHTQTSPLKVSPRTWLRSTSPRVSPSSSLLLAPASTQPPHPHSAQPKLSVSEVQLQGHAHGQQQLLQQRLLPPTAPSALAESTSSDQLLLLGGAADQGPNRGPGCQARAPEPHPKPAEGFTAGPPLPPAVLGLRLGPGPSCSSAASLGSPLGDRDKSMCSSSGSDVRQEPDPPLKLALTRRADWQARHQYRIKFVIQTAIVIYTMIWTVLLIGQVIAQDQLCAATALCPTIILPLVIAFFIAPGFAAATLIVTFTARSWIRQRLERAGKPGYWLHVSTAALMPLTVGLGAVLAAPLLFVPIFGWLFIWVRWVDRKFWSIMCIFTCISGPLSALPLAIVVSWLFVDGYDISARNQESNSLIFFVNMIGYGFAMALFMLSINLRRDAWNVLERLLLADPSTPPWHVNFEQQKAEAYKAAFPTWTARVPEEGMDTHGQCNGEKQAITDYGI